MGRTEDLMDEHTKQELREQAYEYGFTLPRGATKRDVAERVAAFKMSDTLRGNELDSLQRNDRIIFEGDLYRVKGPTKQSHSVEAYRDGITYVFNDALRGPVAVFNKDTDNKIDTTSSVRAARGKWL